MPTVAEMRLLGDSMDDLTRTLLQKRMLEHSDRQDALHNELSRAMLNLQTQNQSAERDYKEKTLGLARDREANQTKHEADTLGLHKATSDRQAAHEGRMEGKADQLFQHQQTHDAIAGLTSAFAQLQQGVQNGSVSAAEANKRAKALVAIVRGSPDKILQQTPFGALLDGDGDLFKAPDKSKGRVIYKPDPNDPDGPMQPQIIQELGAEDLEALVGSNQPGGASRAKASPTGDVIRDARLNQIKSEIEKHAAELAKGDNAEGIGSFNPVSNWPGDRREKIAELQAEMAQMLGSNPAAAAKVLPGRLDQKPSPTTNSGPPALVDPGTSQQFRSIDDAKAAGKQKGDVIQLWDPASKKFRPFQLD